MPLKYYGQYLCYDTEAEVMATNGKAGDVAYAMDTDLRYRSNGISWFPTDALRVLRSTVTIDGKTVANSKVITTPPTSFKFVPLGGHVETVAAAGVVTQPTISAGTNATNYDNLFTSTILSGLLTAGGLSSPNALTLAKNITPLPGSTDVYVKVPTLGTAVATTFTFKVDLMGYFKP